MKGKVMKKAFVFDFDDTLATTDCCVLVYDGTVLVERLTPAQFNSYEKPEWYDFDFSEFRSGEFIHNANPTFLMALAKEVHDEGHDVFVLTARADNVAQDIADWMIHSHGVKVIKVYGVGSDDEKVNIPQEKKTVLHTLNQLYDLVYFYDDHPENIELARETGVKVYLV
jgi:FMN phosphatase YigB (HAD superfamily)